jgi:PAS domain S-box/diguanylate cyclase (GGDEF) domain
MLYRENIIKIISLCILIMFTFFSFFEFTKIVSERENDTITANLNDISNQIATTVTMNLTNSVKLLQLSAKPLSSYDNLFSINTLDYIKSISSNNHFSEIWICPTDGQARSANGRKIDFSTYAFCQKALQGSSGITCLTASNDFGENSLVLYIPILRDNTVIGALFGEYDSAHLSSLLRANQMCNHIEKFLVRSDGQMLFPIGKAKGRDATILQSDTFPSMITKNALFQKFKTQRNSTENTTILIDSSKLSFFHIPYSDDLFFVTAVSKQIYKDEIKNVTDAGYRLSVKLLMVFLILFIGMIYYDKESNKKIDDAYRQLSFLNHNLPAGIQKCTADERIEFVYFSDGFLHLSGYTREEINDNFHNRLINMVDPLDREKVMRDIKNHADSNQIFAVKYRMTKKDGQVLWVSDQFQLIEESGKKYFYCIIVDITELTKASEALQISYEQYKIALSQINYLIFEYEHASGEIFIPDDKCSIYPMAGVMKNFPETLINNHYISPSSVSAFLEMCNKIKNGEKSACCDVKIRLANKNYAWHRIFITNIFDEEGNPVKAVGVLQDISKEKDTEFRLIEEENYRKTILSETLFIYEFDLLDGNIFTTYFTGNENGDFFTLDQYIPPDSHLNRIHPDDHAIILENISEKKYWDAYHSNHKEIKIQFRILCKDDSWIWVEEIVHFYKSPLDETINGIAYIKNIDEQKRLELELKNKAQRDSMTGLYNRATIEEHINNRLKAQDSCCVINAFFVLDIDYFKKVNDTYGHITGDLLLKEIAVILTKLFRESDLIGRLGGDEFAVLMKNVASMEAVTKKATEICHEVKNLSLDFIKDNNVTVSMGIALTPEDGLDFDTLYQNADFALYEAKNNGRNAFLFYRELEEHLED